MLRAVVCDRERPQGAVQGTVGGRVFQIGEKAARGHIHL